MENPEGENQGINWQEFAGLVAGAREALSSGQLSDWQGSDASMFHLIGLAVLDLYDRINKASSDQSLVNAPKPVSSIILAR